MNTKDFSSIRFRAGGDYFYDKTAFENLEKNVLKLKDDETYRLYVESLSIEKEFEMCFRLLFGRQRRNLQNFHLLRVKLFADPFRMFAEKPWGNLVHF